MLLSEKDLAAVAAALEGGTELVLERSLGDLRIAVSTSRAPPVWQPAAMLARVECWAGHIYSTQWCASPEEVRQACRSGSACASGPGRW